MKKNEIALLILIVSIVALLSYLLVNALVGEAANKTVLVEKAEPFSSKVAEPDPLVFNPQAINPTVKVKIGDQSGQQPFTINQ